MEVVVLSIHLIVCIALIGLVLLQRSEGGALGMGGGGSGSLMSGRGAADALARMTSVAGGFFLVTSLSLTVLSGAASSSTGRSVLDLLPSNTQPIVPPITQQPATPAPAPAETPDPTESSVEPATRLVSIGPAEAAAAPANTDAARAGPIANRPPAQRPTQQTAAAQPPAARSTPAAATSNQTAARTPPATQNRQANNTATTRQPVVANSSGAVSGITLTDSGQTQPESVETGNGLEAVRRERAGPDQ